MIFDSLSGAEKIGWLGLVGGIIVALVKVVKFIYNFSEEHDMLVANMKQTSPLVTRVTIAEIDLKVIKEERGEILEEIKGLRQDINDVLKLMITGHQKGN